MNTVLNSKLLTFGILAAVLIFGLAFLKHEPKLQKAKREESQIDAQLEGLRQRQNEIEAKKEYFQSESYLERQARIKLNYQKPGEKVVYVYHTAEEQHEADAPVSFLNQWQLWWYYLISR